MVTGLQTGNAALVAAAADEMHANAADVSGNNVPVNGGTYNPDGLTVADVLSTAGTTRGGGCSGTGGAGGGTCCCDGRTGRTSGRAGRKMWPPRPPALARQRRMAAPMPAIQTPIRRSTRTTSR